MDKEALKNKLIIEILSIDTSDVKLLGKTISDCLVNFSVTQYKELLPSTGDGSTTRYLFTKFEEEKYAMGCSKKTMKKYFESAQKLFSFVHKELNLVTKEDLTSYFTFYRMGGENHQNNFKPVCDSTVINRQRDLSSFYSWMFKNKYISENPFDVITIAKPKVKPKEIIVNHEVEQMIISCEDYYKSSIKLSRNIAMVLLLIESGVRNSELCNIKVQDVNLEKNCITIRKGKGNKDRKVFFGDRTKKRLEKYLKVRGDVKSDYLFLQYYHDKPMQPSGVENIVRQIGKISNLPRLYPHLFRASFATKMIDAGINPMIVKQLMGHSSLETLNSYVNITDEMVMGALRIAFS